MDGGWSTVSALRCPSCIRPYDATAGRAPTWDDLCEECAVRELEQDADDWWELKRQPQPPLYVRLHERVRGLRRRTG
jgi:hypothetical protein